MKRSHKIRSPFYLQGNEKITRLLHLLVLLVHFKLIIGNSHTPLPEEYSLSEKAEQILTQEINNVNPYGEESPLLQGQYPYPVIFEPIRHIKLSRSTYKVTSFIDFTPHIKAFKNFEKYLDDVSNDMNDTSKMGILEHLQETFGEDFGRLKKGNRIDFRSKLYDIKDTCNFDIGKECQRFTGFLNTCYGEVRDICNAKRKYRKLVSIVGYMSRHRNWREVPGGPTTLNNLTN